MLHMEIDKQVKYYIFFYIINLWRNKVTILQMSYFTSRCRPADNQRITIWPLDLNAWFNTADGIHAELYILSVIFSFRSPVWGGHSCTDCLLSISILLPRTNIRENNLTSFGIFSRGNLLRAKLWTVIRCPGHDGKLQPHRVNILPYRVWDLACWWL